MIFFTIIIIKQDPCRGMNKNIEIVVFTRVQVISAAGLRMLQ